MQKSSKAGSEARARRLRQADTRTEPQVSMPDHESQPICLPLPARYNQGYARELGYPGCRRGVPRLGIPKSVEDTQAARRRLEPQAGTSRVPPITAE